MPSKAFHLIHANIAVARAPLDHPQMADFMARVDRIDAIAAGTPGFVSQPTPADSGSIFKEPELLNLSIWESVESIHSFTYSGQHAAALERRAEWFVQKQKYNYVLYWEEAGEIPLESEIQQRLEHLRTHGPTPYAFTFDQAFTLEQALHFTKTSKS
ncbi:MAG: DUF3291 domain-containing protein [Anaerolineales bacterium]